MKTVQLLKSEEFDSLILLSHKMTLKVLVSVKSYTTVLQKNLWP